MSRPPSTDNSLEPNGALHERTSNTNNKERGALRFDAQEYIGLSEDDVVDYETAEEFLLHFSRIGQLTFVKKLLQLRDSKEIPLNINCKGSRLCECFFAI